MTHHRIKSGRRAATLTLTTIAVMAVGSVAGSAASKPPHPAPPVEVGRAAVPDDEVGMEPGAPAWVRTREHRRLCQLAAAMPSDWPATAAIRRQVEQPLGDTGERDRWRDDAEMLPSYWPAAQVMGAAADGRLGCSFWSGE